MGLPAFLDVSSVGESGDALVLPPEVEAACSALWSTAKSAWAARPDEGSNDEAAAVRAMFQLSLLFLGAAPRAMGAAMRALVNGGLRRLVAEQRGAVDDERAFALRQLEQALDHCAVVSEKLASAGGFVERTPEWLPVASAELDVVPAELRRLYRAQGALFMAFDLLDANDAAALRFWARDAVERWRGVAAELSDLGAVVRSARAQVRARTAWDTWTDADRHHETAAWNALR